MALDDVDNSTIESLKNTVYTIFNGNSGGSDGTGGPGGNGKPDLDPVTIFSVGSLLDLEDEPESDLYPNSVTPEYFHSRWCLEN